MDGGAGEVLRAFFVAVHRGRPLVEAGAVLVVAQDLQIAQATLLQGRAQVVAHELGHLVGRVQHALPVVAVAVRLVFRGEAPKRNAMGLARLRVLDKELRPRGLHLLEEASAHPILVVLHPRRRGPGGGNDVEAILGDVLRHVDHREQEFEVLLNAEVLEVHVTFHRRVAVVEAREVARIHVRPREGVVGPVLREVRLHDLVALRVTQLVDEVG